jgi:hypothetical protein
MISRLRIFWPTHVRPQIFSVICLLGTNNEKIRRLKAKDLVDDSAVRRMKRKGGFKRARSTEQSARHAIYHGRLFGAGICEFK